MAFDAPTRMAKQTNIWVISDGKAGHESQSVGLARAIDELTGASHRVIRIEPAGGRPLAWLFGRAPKPDAQGPPSLVIGTGTTTHPTLRACKRAYGAPTIVIMRPSFGRFDLIIPPVHDSMRESWNVIPTRGAMNLVKSSDRKDAMKGLLLIGGPSKHHGWDSDAMGRQIREIIEHSTDTNWTLTTSRRTPASFVETLKHAFAEVPDARARMDVHPAAATTREWLLDRYAESERIWVSEDSVSMVYEALTSGARVGLLRVPRTARVGRVVKGMDALVSEGWAMWFEDWRTEGVLRAAPAKLDEASRVAEIVVERLGLSRGAP
jgi:mitochondrial fission protein ELM1